MIRIKLIDKLITKSYIGPYILFFFIVEFVLIMQFLWKYIDEILGKGFSIFELLQMIFYYGITIIPMGIPLTILIASVMVYGELSEKYELVSMKSAGISLIRILKAGIIIAILTAAFSLFSSNYLKPIANFKFQSTFVSLRKKKPTLSFEEGIFNKDFNNYTIRVGKKNKDNVSISDVLVYDNSNAHSGEINVISAKNGEMYTTSDGNYFIMKLFNGEHVKEIIDKKNKKKTGRAVMRSSFKEWTKVFDMAVFNSNSSININRNKHDLLNSSQILLAIDSLNIKISKNDNNIIHGFGHKKLKKNKTTQKTSKIISTKIKKQKAKKQFEKEIKKIVHKKKHKRKAFKLIQNDSLSNIVNFRSSLDSSQLRSLTISAYSKSKSLRDKIAQVSRVNKKLNKSKDKFYLRLYQQYSWALICIIFLFIGAPLGSIVKKGGFGFPVLIAISFFIAFILLMITGEKLLRAESLTPLIAAWLPCLTLAPVAVLITIMALLDLEPNDIFPNFKTNEISSPIENIKKLEASEGLQ